MKKLLSRLLGSGPGASVAPQFDEAVARRLEAAGKVPDQVQAQPAEPMEIPVKPTLTGFQGMVRFELTLDDTGRVAAVAMDHAPYDRVTELEAWARSWSFRPAMLEGKAHPCRMVYEVHWH
ncbi:MAG: hypothetical protein IPL96_13705 [Holophagaceae bacterium]|nr:hypothetical protein [Holophagaceae bacterium]